MCLTMKKGTGNCKMHISNNDPDILANFYSLIIMKTVVTIFLHLIASTFHSGSYTTHFIKIWVVSSFDSCSVCLTTNMNFDYWFYVISRQLTTFNDSNTNLKKKFQIFVFVFIPYLSCCWPHRFTVSPKKPQPTPEIAGRDALGRFFQM